MDKIALWSTKMFVLHLSQLLVWLEFFWDQEVKSWHIVSNSCDKSFILSLFILIHYVLWSVVQSKNISLIFWVLLTWYYKITPILICFEHMKKKFIISTIDSWVWPCLRHTFSLKFMRPGTQISEKFKPKNLEL